jgi:hypothetical protein
MTIMKGSEKDTVKTIIWPDADKPGENCMVIGRRTRKEDEG